MKVILEKKVLDQFPAAQVGFVAARVKVEKQGPYTNELKSTLGEVLKERGIHSQNYTTDPDIDHWRKTYEKMGVKPRTYPSSVEALVRRVVKGDSVWNISTVVDLYNCVSVMHMFPMGGYDVGKLRGDVVIRHAREEEMFFPLGQGPAIKTTSKQIVYADDEKVLCWLWNHKDSRYSCIDESTRTILLFFDASELPYRSTLQKAMGDFVERLEENLNGTELFRGIVNAEHPSYDIEWQEYLTEEEESQVKVKQENTSSKVRDTLLSLQATQENFTTQAVADSSASSSVMPLKM
ncbi:MAG: hypothetical protein ACD_44C00201G0027 [uncultured bacterium]|nr:MAG: hypothetical protein ACD_44C00201G0027 [uncultured bacterium]OGT16166.1 MAG: hypothetical protein A3B69_00680 [Gammaproteobacteria bacterium RIFCSPHIGHO2_02_FULL_38_33]OGT23501.1 MAG: hypothetical protein A2W47_05790 [Gammaproteobacteria bacterium RIFCSPHIGHO2_12_38_15]OGT69583.1 MAG: hypothetical protein A3I12_03010 [Gammaproteobacteria bacterium RIFCSPLOWO2_02_FULL_38_11]OGT75429.1 MAG: hypothetical protein A3G71_06265 [Gammaproteobacteria bacterium RIFCSPLOWO2_12_FULL_38_14]